MLKSILICAAVQIMTFIPFLMVYVDDKKKYGDDLGEPLWKRMVAWLIMCPIWALPFMAMIGV